MMDDLIQALLAGQQADADGVMVIVSRQACEEAVAKIKHLQCALNQQAGVTDKAIEAMNRNADLGEAAEQDAARYRWIRGLSCESTRYSLWRVEYFARPNGWQPMQRERMDAAIDNAMLMQMRGKSASREAKESLAIGVVK